MRQLISDLFVSADGYAKGEHSGPYFDLGGPELDQWIATHLAEPQVIVMGRVTYEVLAPMAQARGGANSQPNRFDDLPKIVLSRTLREPLEWPNARQLGGDLATVIGDLKAADGDQLLVRDLVALGLVDRLRLIVFPVVLGTDGREPMFAGYPATRFELLASSVLDQRLVVLEYGPPHQP